MMQALIVNDCPYLTKSQIQYLVKWYITPTHRQIDSVTFLCPHLNESTDLGKCQRKYIDRGMGKTKNIAYNVTTDVAAITNNPEYRPNYVVYVYFGPSHLVDPFYDNPEPVGKIISDHFRCLYDVLKVAQSAVMYTQTFAAERSETIEAIEYLGVRFLHYSTAYKEQLKHNNQMAMRKR